MKLICQWLLLHYPQSNYSGGRGQFIQAKFTYMRLKNEFDLLAFQIWCHLSKRGLYPFVRC